MNNPGSSIVYLSSSYNATDNRFEWRLDNYRGTAYHLPSGYQVGLDKIDQRHCVVDSRGQPVEIVDSDDGRNKPVIRDDSSAVLVRL